jgi:hypothetical protein
MLFRFSGPFVFGGSMFFCFSPLFSPDVQSCSVSHDFFIPTLKVGPSETSFACGGSMLIHLRELFSDGGPCGFISTRFFRPALPAVSFSSSFSCGGSPRVHFGLTFSVSPQFRSIFARSGRKTPDSDPFFFHQIPQGVNAGPFLTTFFRRTPRAKDEGTYFGATVWGYCVGEILFRRFMRTHWRC